MLRISPHSRKAASQPVEAHCDYCNTSYLFEVEEIEEILKNAK
jgi:redox-regulated HSP33 family molecular chaperone